jgi:S-adenosylmethionine hydrolase
LEAVLIKKSKNKRYFIATRNNIFKKLKESMNSQRSRVISEKEENLLKKSKSFYK